MLSRSWSAGDAGRFGALVVVHAVRYGAAAIMNARTVIRRPTVQDIGASIRPLSRREVAGRERRDRPRGRVSTATAAIVNTAVSASQAAVKSGRGTGRTSDQALPDAWKSTQSRTLPPAPTYTQPKRMRTAISVRRNGRKEKVLCGWVEMKKSGRCQRATMMPVAMPARSRPNRSNRAGNAMPLQPNSSSVPANSPETTAAIHVSTDRSGVGRSPVDPNCAASARPYATSGSSTTIAYQRIRTRQRPPARSRAETPARPAKRPATTNAAMPGDPIATRGRNTVPAVVVGLTAPTMTGRSASQDRPNARTRKAASARGRPAMIVSVEATTMLTPRAVLNLLHGRAGHGHRWRIARPRFLVRRYVTRQRHSIRGRASPWAGASRA